MMHLITSAMLAHHDGFGHMTGWDGWGWMWIMGTVVVGGIIVAVLLASIANRNDSTRRREPGPRDVLAARYARGEISTDEYHERLDGLR